MSNMKTEIVVVRLTKHERAMLDAVKTTPLLADWLKILAFSQVEQQEKSQDPK
ncbi:TPA: MbeCy [Providencia alcalifaciens]|uniref:MbeCy n=1 Tax=Providencia alcalifaciens 205/92 TaxID=1256988 RepID=A0AAV3M822_9GAMM|nr:MULTISPECIES: hypothetical protein [Providencia]ETT03768.1 hypothetical protein HMPREF1562_3855 [Providencia alcalifaciens F90-2004]EUC97224.1 hypothetical protein HMPREF1567_1688 [Providencia alcalifaciens PAL-2]EUD03986.1 hypothetical protein HMPREF1565_2761 [Providencia alcalifaciens RIMD 1656011]EUD08391.1 hypothetical protein HMPREF1564_3294 [Providencia alcalifaciens R90-1475]EUD11895.1 hypothetical protein HMPREF1563_1503 [Providencia alcalifaciens 205/92]